MAPSIFNLIKNIVGAGVLSLPAGIAAFSDSKAAVLPAVGMVAGMGILSMYCFVLIGRLCEMTKTSTYKDAVAKTMGNKAGYLMGVATTLKTGELARTDRLFCW